MGADLRIGRGGEDGYYTRYRVYNPDVNIKDKLSLESNLIGILHAKDITSYETRMENVNNKFGVVNTRASLETSDIIDIKPNSVLYSIDEECYYIVVAVAPNSHNKSQQNSRRPINTTRIDIRRSV